LKFILTLAEESQVKEGVFFRLALLRTRGLLKLPSFSLPQQVSDQGTTRMAVLKRLFRLAQLLQDQRCYQLGRQLVVHMPSTVDRQPKDLRGTYFEQM